MKANPMSDASPGTFNTAQLQFTGNFAGGNIRFAYKISS